MRYKHNWSRRLQILALFGCFIGIATPCMAVEPGSAAPVAGAAATAIAGLGAMGLKQARELIGKIGKSIKDMRNKNADESRDWTAEDNEAWETCNNDYNRVARHIQGLEVEGQLRQRPTDPPIDQTRHTGDPDPGGDGATLEVNERTRALALQAWLRSSNDLDLTDEQRQAAETMRVNLRGGYDIQLRDSQVFTGNQRSFVVGGRPQQRAMSIGTDADGGFTVPTGFSDRLEEKLLAFGGPRGVADIMRTTSGIDMPWPNVDDTGNTGVQLGENASIGASVDPTFASVTFKAWKFSSKPVLISSELLEDSAFNLAQVIGDALGTRLGRITATVGTTGNGTTTSEGCSTGATLGVTAASGTAFVDTEVLALVHSVDPAYRGDPSVAFMMHDNIILEVRKLKDSNGAFIWQPGLQEGTPDKLLKYPVAVNQDMDSTLAVTKRIILFGAWNRYGIRDVNSVRLYRLEERYRDNDQTGFVAFMRTDSRYINADAVKALDLAAV